MEANVAKAKLFMHGRSQAVRLPKEFRFEGTEVFVRRMGDEVVLSSRRNASMQSLVDALDAFEPGFELVRQQPAEADAREPVQRRAARARRAQEPGRQRNGPAPGLGKRPG